MDSTFPFRSSSPRGRERDDLDRLRLARRLSEPVDRHALVRLEEVHAQCEPQPLSGDVAPRGDPAHPLKLDHRARRTSSNQSRARARSPSNRPFAIASSASASAGSTYPGSPAARARHIGRSTGAALTASPSRVRADRPREIAVTSPPIPASKAACTSRRRSATRSRAAMRSSRCSRSNRWSSRACRSSSRLSARSARCSAFLARSSARPARRNERIASTSEPAAIARALRAQPDGWRHSTVALET